MKKEKVDRVISLSKKLKDIDWHVDTIRHMRVSDVYGVSGMFGSVDVPKKYIDPALKKYLDDMEEARKKIAKELEEL